MDSTIKTPQTHPQHPVVGHYFGANRVDHREACIYYCDSYDPAQGYWMTNVHEPSDRRNVSERAIGRTFHEAELRVKDFYIVAWHVSVPRIGCALVPVPAPADSQSMSTQWIKLTDRHPEPMRRVLTFTESHHRDKALTSADCVGIQCWNATEKRWCDDNGEPPVFRAPSHWMPLPEIPS